MIVRRKHRRRRADVWGTLNTLERFLVRTGRVHHRGRCSGVVRFGTPEELRPIMEACREHLEPGVTPDTIVDLSNPERSE